MKKFTLMLVIFLFSFSWLARAEDLPQPPDSPIKATLLAEITEKGQKINAVALEYEDNILSGMNLDAVYQIETSLDNQSLRARNILRAYVNDKPETTFQPKPGKFVIIELNKNDHNAIPYDLRKENTKPLLFRSKDENGRLIDIEKLQVTSVPDFYNDRLVYYIKQNGLLKLTNGKTLEQSQVMLTAEIGKIKTPYLDRFMAKSVMLQEPKNKLNYQLYSPIAQEGKKYPLTVFLHGSGQVGSDNLAHLLSSKGAVATLLYEDGFVLAPQYDSIFDPFDDIKKGSRGGIHWQTDNRINLVLKMIDETIAENPMIDSKRIYVTGLSRGAEGGLNLLLKRPNFFAGALLMSGREAYTLEWVDGNANKDNLAVLKDMSIWFFHSKEDKVSPVRGSRINYQILHQELKAPNVKYTEFTTLQAGDNGIVNNNPHNTWDAVFNSPEVIQWLLMQKSK
ncbi:phospholipase [[Pasteurella] aerogenes]